MKHDLSGSCESCLALITKYPGFHSELQDWFFSIQKANPEAHISCAGRGEIEQNILHARGATKARWLDSAHNYNAALDIFRLHNGKYDLDKDWFQKVVGSRLLPFLKWYGLPGSRFFELPHVELALWRTMVKAFDLEPVE